jgi:hypothetical protein
MQLLPEEKMVWSPVGANSRMNRSRNASGINSYEKEFLFNPEDYLLSTIKSKGNATSDKPTSASSSLPTWKKAVP